MKVQFWKSANILAISNVNFTLNLNVHLSKVDDEVLVWYNPFDLLQFVDSEFLPAQITTSEQDFKHTLKLFLYPGCTRQFDDKVLVTVEGLR